MNANDYLSRVGLGNPEQMSSPGYPPGMIPVVGAKQWLRRPVIYKLPANWVETLQQTDVNVPPDQYNQSYPSIMIQHPDGELTLASVVDFFSPTRRNPNGEQARYLELSHSYGLQSVPLPKGAQGKYSHMWTRLGLTVRLDQAGWLESLNRDAKTIEESVRETERLTNKEIDDTRLYNRVAINALLLLAGHPLYRVRTERERLLLGQTKHFNRAKANDAKQRLRLMPQFIDFVNPPRIGMDYGTNTDLTKKPHWRRGHWRHQAFGPAWTDHKWLFIERVMIHENQSEGGDAETVFNGKGSL